ncbi:MAG: hypothetical protein ACLQOO_24045 [Terriglobia bacterium]
MASINAEQLSAALYKPENFDSHKKYPMMVYIHEKLTQNVNHYVEPRPMHSINISYYVSNGYLGADARYRLHHRLSRAERAEVRAAGDSGGCGSRSGG